MRRRLNWTNQNANAKSTLGMAKSSYNIASGAGLLSDANVVGEIKNNPSILINLEGCPITSFVGSANMGQSAPVIAVANREIKLFSNGTNVFSTTDTKISTSISSLSNKVS